jgi:hypothetical protein
VIGAQRRASCAKAVLHYSFVRNGRARAAKVKIDCQSDPATVCNTHPARWVRTAGSSKRRCRFESIGAGLGSGALVGVARQHLLRFKISGLIGSRDEIALVSSGSPKAGWAIDTASFSNEEKTSTRQE